MWDLEWELDKKRIVQKFKVSMPDLLSDIDFFDRYKKIHRYCPKCGSPSITRTCVGYIRSFNVEYRDLNRAVCNDCGWEGIVHDLTCGKNVRK